MRPMLAAKADLTQLHFPLYASPKLDGVRALVVGGFLLSRTQKLIPNMHCQDLFNKFEGYDGELILGDPTAPDVYRKTVSAVMTAEGFPEVSFYVFDQFKAASGFEYRMSKVTGSGAVGVFPLAHEAISNLDQLLVFEQLVIDQGYEGLILRDPIGLYKNGRSTVREGGMLKLKRFVDDEAVVVGFEELMHNSNAATLDERGYTKRSSEQAGDVPMNTLGALKVKWQGKEFSIGTGFTEADRFFIWMHRADYLGKLAKFKYFPVGMKDLPRHPVFLGWRSPLDV